MPACKTDRGLWIEIRVLRQYSIVFALCRSSLPPLKVDNWCLTAADKIGAIIVRL